MADTGDATPDAACDDGLGNCTLREALAEANSLADADTINFNIAGSGPHIIQLTEALPEVLYNVDISNNSGESVTVRGEGPTDAYRIFTIARNITVSISNLSITNGGGGIFILLSELTLNNVSITGHTVVNSSGGGGVLALAAVLNINNSTISGNTVNPPEGFSGTAGGIRADGRLTLTNSTVSDNFTEGSGGGIRLSGGPEHLITNTTISGNSATAFGGGLLFEDEDFHTLRLTAVTITNNRSNSTGELSVPSGGGFVNDFAGLIFLQNTIISGNFAGPSPGTVADDVGGGVDSSSSYNLIGTGSNLVNGVNQNQVGINNPGLEPLAFNGGPTQTHAVQSNSPALDKGDSFGLTTDQRGSLRPFDFSSTPNATNGDGADIGAFELDGGITKDQCKNNGWQDLFRANGTVFKNQGDCIQYVNTGK